MLGSDQQAPGRWETTRVEAVSDGVFAIAITLLVIEIKVDPSEFRHLEHALIHEWPGYLAYVTSFLTIGGVWISHHNLFTRLQFVDPSVLVINLLLLMATAFLPFPTGVLAQALNSSAEAQQTAVVFYGCSALCVEALLGVLDYYAKSHPHLMHDLGRSPQPRVLRVTISVASYAVAIVVGLLAPDVAAVAYLAIAIGLVAASVGEARAAPGGVSAR